MPPKLSATLAALNLFIAVGCGAFGAHALKTRLAPDLLAVWQTAVQYQLIHGLGLFALAWLATQTGAKPFGIAAWLMQAGIVLFCGSLYVLALSGVRWLGAVTPLGGVAFLAAWLLVAVGAWRYLPR
ncbi:DUF423 domain-containing protein [Andreprevotia chitinilytica]|uniref:DUF423 domain-containing protein n=1 Tax=Andreprevotia chitinilytica TaxID=396808 RepID=UPI0005547B59|nr:DUF423 domain-containing protein [Andreprevotia chitinilytica]